MTQPQPGQFVKLCHRFGRVVNVLPHHGDHHGVTSLLEVSYPDTWSHPESDQVVWHLEEHTGAKIMSSLTLPNHIEGQAEDPADPEAMVDACRWTALDRLPEWSADPLVRAQHAPLTGVWHSAVEPEDNQLIPVLKALAMPRVAHAYGLTEDEFAHILLDTGCGAVGFGKTDTNLPAAHRQPQLTLDAYRQLLHKGLDRFLQDGAEIPEAALQLRHPLIEIWSPRDRWETAWADARAMADSDHEWDLFLSKEHAVQTEYGTPQAPLDLAGAPEHGQCPYQTDPEPGALFNPEEFRRDGQRRLL